MAKFKKLTAAILAVGAVAAGAAYYYKKTKEILENGTSILKEFYDIV